MDGTGAPGGSWAVELSPRAVGRSGERGRPGEGCLGVGHAVRWVQRVENSVDVGATLGNPRDVMRGLESSKVSSESCSGLVT